jgi:hypothetical protein
LLSPVRQNQSVRIEEEIINPVDFSWAFGVIFVYSLGLRLYSWGEGSVMFRTDLREGIKEWVNSDALAYR